MISVVVAAPSRAASVDRDLDRIDPPLNFHPFPSGGV